MIRKILAVIWIFSLSTSISLGKETPNNATVFNPNKPIFSTGGNGSVKGKTVGTCNSAKGCTRLAAACKGGYKYTKTKSGGLCTTKSTKQGKLKLTSIPHVAEDAKCFDVKFCQKLKAKCHGEKKWGSNTPGHGTCKD